MDSAGGTEAPKAPPPKSATGVDSSIAIILMGKRELVVLLNLSSWCLVMVERLFLAVPRGCQQFVIVVLPDHTHLLFPKPNFKLVGKLLVFRYSFWNSCRMFGRPWASRNYFINIHGAISLQYNLI